MLTDEVNVEIRDREGLCGVAQRYFDKLFEARDGRYEPILSLVQLVISTEDNLFLTAPILKEELYEALIHMHPDKSPGPDGFNPDFYQNFWITCGDDIYSEAKVWLDRVFFPPSLNNTNICLIPKCCNPNSMKD